MALMPNEWLLSQLEEPDKSPELSAERRTFEHWCFYRDFCSVHATPARQSQVGVRTPILVADGADLAAAL